MAGTTKNGRGAAAVVASVCLAAGLAAAPASASTVLSREIHLSVQEDGSVVERFALRVRLDEAGDLSDWSPFPVPLDTNRTLISASGWGERPDGSRVILGSDDLEIVEGVAGGGVLHTSTELRLLRFPPLPAGSELAVSYEVEERPWLPGGAIRLLGEDPVERLSVVIEQRGSEDGGGDGAGLRWLLDGVAEVDGAEAEGGDEVGEEAGEEAGAPGSATGADLAVEETPNGLRLEAVDLPGLEPGEDAPVLRYAWGPVRSWPDVARWYEELIREVPRGTEAVRRTSAETFADVDELRDRVATALDFVRRRVRYVAVEVGVGGYRPSAPEEVLERRWGDCKDKSFLLIDLLAAAGVEAYPALVLLDGEDRVDDRFPGADQFNHLIVAVPAEAVAAAPGDVVADGYLFLDATQDRGGLTWIHPSLQGQRALVVRGEESRLITLPVLAEREARELEVRLTVEPSGDAAGEVHLGLGGAGGWRLAVGTASASPERLSEVARRLLSGLLDGASIGTPRWREGEVDGVPTVELTAPVRFPGLVVGRTTRSMALPGPDAFPASSELSESRGRSVRPVRWTVVWELGLPHDWCPPREGEIEVVNELGSFHQRVTTDGVGAGVAQGATVWVERRAELAVRWVEPEMVELARELALAERRALRRRLRLECAPGAGDRPGNPSSGGT